jgi:predicted RNA-binding protein YlxR (DUF448 family)
VRTCVGCGREALKSELLRLALAGGDAGAPPRQAVLDRDARLGGRGAYLCRAAADERPRSECLAAAMKRGGFARALRAKVALDPKLVESVGR